MNRLNFTQMVNKTLLDQQNTKFFNTTRTNTDGLNVATRFEDKLKQAKERLNLDGKIQNIVLSVHEQLRERDIRQKRGPTKTKLREKIKPKTPVDPNRLQQKPKPIEVKEKIKPKKPIQAIDPIEPIECQNISLPRIKVLCSEKHKKCVHKCAGASSHYISFENHNRMLNALQRQNEMQNMLKEHKLIKEGRQSLEQDIFAMRHILDDIEHRVNNSLKQLNSKKTYCECHGLTNTQRCKKCNSEPNKA